VQFPQKLISRSTRWRSDYFTFEGRIGILNHLRFAGQAHAVFGECEDNDMAVGAPPDPNLFLGLSFRENPSISAMLRIARTAATRCGRAGSQ
jgi:hypothetical protein